MDFVMMMNCICQREFNKSQFMGKFEEADFNGGRYMVKEIKYGNTKCYVIDNKVMVDTDWAGTLQAFYSCLKENDIFFSKIKYLIITHFHPDHMGIAQDLAELGIKLIVFNTQKDYIHFSDKIFEKDKSLSYKPIDDKNILFLSCEESRAFLSENGIAGEVISTPGHSDDSVSVILDEGIAIVGDLYPIHSVPAYNDSVLEESWNRILARNLGIVYYGHAKEDVITGIKNV